MRSLLCDLAGDGGLALAAMAAVREMGHRIGRLYSDDSLLQARAGALGINVRPLAAAADEASGADVRFLLTESIPAAEGQRAFWLRREGDETFAWCRGDGRLMWSEREEPAEADEHPAIAGLRTLVARLGRGETPEPLTTGESTGEAIPATLAGFLPEAARRWPEATALVADGSRFSFRELESAVEGVALALQAQQGGALRPDAPIGLHAPRDTSLIIGLLAILRAGGAYVPLDPANPDERLRYMAADAGLVALLADEPAVATRLGLPATAFVSLRQPSASPGAAAAAASGPDDLAYIIYTSGSTGRPKGVAVPHRGVCNMAAAHRDLLHIGPGDRVLQFASIGFDASVAEIFPALLAGATLHVASEVERHAPEALHGFLERERISVATLMASVAGHLPRRQLPDLHSLMLAGETPAAETLAFWSRGRRLYNAYGPTEASVSVCASLYAEGVPANRIGRALPNLRLHVLDQEGRPVRQGEVGELCVGGIGVARGYLGQPAQTAERFLANPFGEGRLYRTGDLVVEALPGVYDYVGRSDSQVKLAGVRLELDEVARLLDRFPGIRQSCVLLEEAVGGKSLVACFVADGVVPSDAELLRGLARSLPEALLPARFVKLPALPLNASDKVDRVALLRLVQAAAGPQEAPATETERDVAALWREALGLVAIGRGDNFYGLGGDSLRATWLLQQLNARFGLRLVASRFRALATLADLAAYIDRETAAAREQVTVEDF